MKKLDESEEENEETILFIQELETLVELFNAYK
jgi:hypothetical protein